MFCLTLYHLIALCLQFVVILFDNSYSLVNKSSHGTTYPQRSGPERRRGPVVRTLALDAARPRSIPVGGENY